MLFRSNGIDRSLDHVGQRDQAPVERERAPVHPREVEEIVETGTFDPDSVHLPGIYVSRLVLLAMDGVYGADGKLDKERTDFLVSNDYALEVAGRYPEQFWAGVSINPARTDAVEEAERCARAGAKLVKLEPVANGTNFRIVEFPPEKDYIDKVSDEQAQRLTRCKE